MHAPHLMHLDWLMMWGARTAPEMAPVGQPSTQAGLSQCWQELETG